LNKLEKTVVSTIPDPRYPHDRLEGEQDMNISSKFWRSTVLTALLIPLNATGQGHKEQIEKMHQDPKAYIAMLENPQRAQEHTFLPYQYFLVFTAR
jgi:hypothetical protein